jgi:predicted NAD/FAD-binding protein
MSIPVWRIEVAQRIAVVGSGIAGLGAAWLLARRHHVTLYERDPRLGGHSNTVEVEDHGRRVPIDTGFIVYNELNYPHLSGLFATLGVPTQASDMSFAAAVDGVEYAGDSFATLFAQRRRLLDPVHWRMLVDIARFNRDAKRALAAEAAGATAGEALGRMTLGEFLDRGGYGRALRERYLLPMGGAIWSCPTGTMLGFPAASFLRFLANHRLLDLEDRPQWRTVTGGSREYLRRLLDSARNGPFPLTVHRGQPVTQVLRRAAGVELIVGGGQVSRYDHVVLAGHAPDSLAIIAEPTAAERELLGAFRYQRNRALLHRDPRLMPKLRRAWSSWNYAAAADGDAGARVAVTYWMNRLQQLPTPTDWFVSLNPVVEPDPATIAAAFEYEHPVFSAEAIRAQRELKRIQGRDRLWFAGAWQGYGFHEDGLRSAVEVAAGFGIVPPWAARGAGDDAPDLKALAG